MPRFEPFHALRYADGSLDQLIAPPYDVLSDADVEALAARSEHNIVHVDVPRDSDQDSNDSDQDSNDSDQDSNDSDQDSGYSDRYTRAATVLHQWLATGVLVPDPSPSFTIYRLGFTDATGQQRTISGVLGGLEVVDEGAGGVLPHERTTPKASTDRLDLTRATSTNLSPVWGLSLAQGLTELLAEPGQVLGRVSDDGVEHVVERVSDPERVEAIRRLVGSDDVLIADGHHRYGISRTYRDEVRAATGSADTPAEQTLTFVNELVADQLSVEAIHRLYTGIDAPGLAAALERRFTRTPIERPTPDTLAAMQGQGAAMQGQGAAMQGQGAAMQDEGYLVLLTPDGAERLDPRPEAFAGIRSLDGAWLEESLADTVAEVTYQHGLDEVLAAVDSGACTAAVLIRPVSVAEIERTAREGLLMPPKSTFFTPKLKTGFVLRPLA